MDLSPGRAHGNGSTLTSSGLLNSVRSCSGTSMTSPCVAEPKVSIMYFLLCRRIDGLHHFRSVSSGTVIESGEAEGRSRPRLGKTPAVPDSRLVSLGIGGYQGIFYDKPDCAAYVRRLSH